MYQKVCLAIFVAHHCDHRMNANDIHQVVCPCFMHWRTVASDLSHTCAPAQIATPLALLKGVYKHLHGTLEYSQAGSSPHTLRPTYTFLETMCVLIH